jgi:hypothetical protein
MAGGSDATVIQRVVREVGSGMAYPVLTKTNYSEWSMHMKLKLKARRLWVAVNKGGVDPQEDIHGAGHAHVHSATGDGGDGGEQILGEGCVASHCYDACRR